MKSTCLPAYQLLPFAPKDHHSNPPREQATIAGSLGGDQVEADVQGVAPMRCKTRLTSDATPSFPPGTRCVPSSYVKPTTPNSSDSGWQNILFYIALSALAAIMSYLIWKT
jgi:hypothetical protein